MKVMNILPKNREGLLQKLKYLAGPVLAFSLSSCPSIVSGNSATPPAISPIPTKAQPSSSLAASPKPLPVPATTIQNAAAVSWNSYFGSTGGAPSEWAGAVRGVGRGETGKLNSDTAPFIQELTGMIGAQQRTVMLPVGGLNSAKTQTEAIDFFNGVKKDKGKQWKDIVYKQALRVAKIPYGTERVYWQIGNEINSQGYSRAIQSLGNSSAQYKPRPNDEATIPYYVEYYLAPSVESLRKVSRDLYKSDDKIKIALGSIANASNSNSIEWQNTLLSYRIRGDFAPSLAGKQVKDLVNILTIHYLITVGDGYWRNTLDTLWSRWVGQGGISGIWLTEEIGKLWAYSGRGAATALKVTARYLDWTESRSLKPAQGRAFLWGANISKSGTTGTTGDDGMKALYSFLGNAPIRRSPGSIKLDSPEGMESYLFQSISDPTKKVAFIFPSSAGKPGFLDKPNLNEREKTREEKRARKRQREKHSGELEQVVRSLQGFSVNSEKLKGNISGTMHVFSPAGHSVSSISVSKQTNSYKFSIGKSVPLPDQSLALIFIQEKK
jgi:hypothetical protein